MREIEFRGKRIGNGEWLVSKTVVRADGGFFLALSDAEVYGDYGNKEGVTHLCCNRGFLAEASPETVGQFTGLEDRNGKRIYEGDIAKVTDDADEMQSDGSDTGIGSVEFYRGLWYVDNGPNNALYDLDPCGYIEVIGNIYDNPELLEVQH